LFSRPNPLQTASTQATGLQFHLFVPRQVRSQTELSLIRRTWTCRAKECDNYNAYARSTYSYQYMHSENTKAQKERKISIIWWDNRSEIHIAFACKELLVNQAFIKFQVNNLLKLIILKYRTLSYPYNIPFIPVTIDDRTYIAHRSCNVN